MTQGEKKHLTEKQRAVLFAILMFGFMLLFFTVLHPIPIMDGDDISYTVLVRKAIPVPGAWNPARVLPEVMITLCSMLSALLTRLGAGTFIHCQVFVYAVIFSLFITAYFAAFRALLTANGIPDFTADGVMLFFVMLHFLIFRTKATQNLYMFHAYNACCVFYYTVPALLAAALVLWQMAGRDLQKIFTSGSIARKSLWLTLLYFSIYSNLFGSVLLVAFSGWKLLQGLVLWARASHTAKERKESIGDPQAGEAEESAGAVETPEMDVIGAGKQFFRNCRVHLLIVLFWLSAALLEATGGRAASLGIEDVDTSFLPNVGNACSIFFRTIAESNVVFRLLVVGLLLAGLVLWLWRKRNGDDAQEKAESVTEVSRQGDSDSEQVAGREIWRGRYSGIFTDLLGCGLVSFVLLMPLLAAADPEYAARPEAIFVIVSVLFMLLALILCDVLEMLPWAGMLLPVALILMFGITNTRFLTFADSNQLEMNGHAAVRLENEIYESIIAATERGEKEIWVPVPKSNLASNWPHIGNVGSLMTEFFYKYGIIDQPIKVHIVPSEEINERYDIHFP